MIYHFPGGGQSHASFPDGTKLGLTTGLAQKFHQFVFFCQTKKTGAKLAQFPDQQLMGKYAVLLTAISKDLRGQHLKLSEISQVRTANKYSIKS